MLIRFLGAKRLSEQIGAYHTDLNIDKAIVAHECIIADAFDGFKAKFAVHGGTNSENLALQNIQARNRLVVSYELAQLSTQARGLPRAGASLLVLGSGNVDGKLLPNNHFAALLTRSRKLERILHQGLHFDKFDSNLANIL